MLPLSLPSVVNLLTSCALVLTPSVSPEIISAKVDVNTDPDLVTFSPSYTSGNPYHLGPKVDQAHSGNVTTVLGRNASLRCRVVNRVNETVSWIRHRDLHLLTVGQYTYTSDQRFQALYESSTSDWVLLVASVQIRDRGVYECQIGTTPPISHFVGLHIEEPRTEILGGGDLHVNTGSTINLTCLVLNHPRSPGALTWLHQGKEIHYDSARGGVSVVTEAGEVMKSALLIQKAALADAGTYTCQPTGADTASATVHVLRDELRQAMQGGVGGGGFPGDALLVTLAALICLCWASVLPYHHLSITMAGARACTSCRSSRNSCIDEQKLKKLKIHRNSCIDRHTSVSHHTGNILQSTGNNLRVGYSKLRRAPLSALVV